MTLVPITAPIEVLPLPEPELVIVPALLIEDPESEVVPELVLFIIILLVPVLLLILPLKYKGHPELFEVLLIVKLLFNVILPEKVQFPLSASLCIVKVPLLPEATVIGFAQVWLKPSLDFTDSVALAIPLVSPRVITFAESPRELLFAPPTTLPALIVKPPVKVLATLANESVLVPC